MKIAFVLLSFATLSVGAGCAVDAQSTDTQGAEVGTQTSALTEDTEAATEAVADPQPEELPSDDLINNGTGLKDCGGLHQACLSGCRMNRNTNCRADCDQTYTNCKAGGTGFLD